MKKDRNVKPERINDTDPFEDINQYKNKILCIFLEYNFLTAIFQLLKGSQCGTMAQMQKKIVSCEYIKQKQKQNLF